MKKIVLIFTLFITVSLTAGAQLDSIVPTRFVTSSTSVGVGHVNILDTYLSPLNYNGTEVRYINEKMHLTNMMHGNVSAQRLLQVNVSYSSNPTEDNNAFAGLVNFAYALHYQFHVNDNLKFLVGPAAEMNLGFVYNLNNGNNPASAKLYANLSASGMAIYKFNIGHKQWVARYQLCLPMIGLMFSPHYGESYYEIFTLHHNSNLVHFTTYANQPSERQMVTLDIPVSNIKLRLSYMCDIQQSHIDNIKTHTWSNLFMIGLVRDFYVLSPGVHQHLSERYKAY